MYPRQRAVRRVALALTAAFALCGAPPVASTADRFATTKLLDSLFYAARYDTLQRILPGMVRRAEAKGDSAFVGRLVFQRGRVHITLGHQAVASNDFDRSIRLAEATGDTTGLMSALHFKAFVLRDRGQYDDAMALFERELDLARRVRSEAAQASAISQLAYRDLRRGDLDRARVGYHRALVLYRHAGNRYAEAGMATSMGLLHRSLGNPDSCRYWYVTALHLARQYGYPMPELWGWNNLGLLESDVGNQETAVDYYQRALAIGKRIGFDRGQALPALNLSLAWSYLGEPARAMKSLDQCIEVCERAGFSDLKDLTTVTSGRLNLAAGRQRAAAALFREVLAREFVYDRMRRSEAAIGLALALAELDSVDRAAQVLEPFAAPGVSVPDHMIQPYLDLTYAEMLRRQGKYAPALERALQVRNEMDRAGRTEVGVWARLIECACRRGLGDAPRGVAVLRAALDSLEIARTGVGEAEWREAYGQHMANDLIEGCRIVLEYPREAPREERVRAFYDTLQRFKTRTLLERIQDPRGEGGPIPRSMSRSMTLRELQGDVLRRGDLLLDVFASARQSYLFAVTTDSCRLVTLPGVRSDLADRVRLYGELLGSSSKETRDAYPPARLIAMQRFIASALLEPVADLVVRSERITYASDGFYASIPVGTLVLGGDDRMLMETKSVECIPSAGVLRWARAEPVSNPDSAATVIAIADGTADDLPGALREVRSLERRYARVERVSERDSVLGAIARRADRGRILHIAAHAQVNDDSPWQSGFLLGAHTAAASGGEARHANAAVDSALVAAGQRAPTLRAWEIARTDLPYGLAVLAGCATAGGRATNGEGVLGLTSAFLSAGVPVVVSSLWPVDDRVTARLMSRFYDRLAAGDPVATALRVAQLSIRSDARTAHPFYWAGFTVVGDGSRVIRPLPSRRIDRVWLAASGLTILLAGMALFTRRRAREKRGPSHAY